MSTEKENGDKEDETLNDCTKMVKTIHFSEGKKYLKKNKNLTYNFFRQIQWTHFFIFTNTNH